LTGALVRGRLSPDEKRRIEEMSDAGLTPGQIARRLNRLYATVNFAMTTAGLRAPKPRRFSFVRKGRPVRSFSPEEDTLIEALRCQSFTTTKIAEIVTKRWGHRRQPATISIRLRQLATISLLREEAGA
jgi:IS30 family transposase